MRLLEFSQAEGDQDPQETAHISARIRSRPVAQPARVLPARQVAGAATPAARVFPVKAGRVHMPAKRGPIDLENLQQRVELLEKRIRARTEINPADTPDFNLEQLRKRLQILERNLNSELWAAKQREYTLLEMLARPTLSARIGKGIARFRSHQLPAIGRSLLGASREWWHDTKPDWWPGLAKAWQASLDDARETFK